MEIWLLAISALLPIVKLVLFPARAIGRGGNWTIVGAAMIVCLMMALWFGMQSLSDSVAAPGAPETAAKPPTAEQQADLDALAKLLQ